VPIWRKNLAVLRVHSNVPPEIRFIPFILLESRVQGKKGALTGGSRFLPPEARRVSHRSLEGDRRRRRKVSHPQRKARGSNMFLYRVVSTWLDSRNPAQEYLTAKNPDTKCVWVFGWPEGEQGKTISPEGGWAIYLKGLRKCKHTSLRHIRQCHGQLFNSKSWVGMIILASAHVKKPQTREEFFKKKIGQARKL